MKTIKTAVALILCIAIISFPEVFAAKSKAELVSPPSRTVFYEGKDWCFYGSEVVPYFNFDLEGTVVNYNGTEKSFYYFPWGGNMWAEPVSGSWHTGKNSIYIYLDDYDGEVYAESEIVLAPLTKINVITQPANTTLIEGLNWHYDASKTMVIDLLDLSGLSIKAFYSDGTDEIINYSKNSSLNWEVPSDVVKFSLGKNKFDVVFNSKRADVYYDFVLESVQRVSVSTEPNKYEYNYGSDWTYKNGKICADVDLNGLSIIAAYNNGKKETISYKDYPSRFKVVEEQNLNFGTTLCKVAFDGKVTFWINFVVYSYGDINVDGIINSADALLVLRNAVKKIEFDSVQTKYADVNADGRINSSDALQILNRSVGIINGFYAEQ